MLRAKKRLGQNFLVDERVIDKIVRAVEPRSDETIVEIGPGLGALTSRLIADAGRVIALEFDRELIQTLNEKFSAAQNLHLLEGDALHVDFCEAIAPATSARLVANLPYNIATAILQRLIEQRNCLTELVLMLQLEVVDRMVAPPSTSERGFLSVLVEAYAEVERLFDVPPTAFRPAPKVWSTVIRLHPRENALAGVKDERLLWQIVSAGFAQRRKTIFNNLRNAPANLRERIDGLGGAQALLEIAKIELQRRAETLTYEDWARLSNLL
jgi:16S rRNA (adenine1518-N6/adenine1519-N6)-dimethyltransferase